MKLAGGKFQSVLKVLIGEGFVVSILEDTPTATATFAGSISGQSLPFPRSRKRRLRRPTRPFG